MTEYMYSELQNYIIAQLTVLEAFHTYWIVCLLDCQHDQFDVSLREKYFHIDYKD